MHLLFCTTMFEHAMTGAGRFAQCVAKLPEYYPDVEVSILSEDIPESRESGYYRVTLSNGATSRYSAYWYKSADYAGEIGRWIETLQPDVIFFNDAWLAYHWLNFPQHGPVAVFLHDDNAIRIWGNAVAAIPGLVIRRWMERHVIRRSTCVLTNASYLQHLISRVYSNSGKTHVIPLAFTDYSKLQSTVQNIDPGQPVRLLFVKNDLRRGGLQILVEALRGLPRYHFELTVVGPQNDRRWKYLEKQIDDSPNIKCDFQGRIFEHDQVLRLMNAHHVYCVPAVREAFGVSNLEALASGMRVVYFQTGGIPVALEQFGWESKTRAVGAIREAIMNAIEADIEVVEKKIETGRKWLMKEYTMGKMFMALYQELRATYLSTLNPKASTA